MRKLVAGLYVSLDGVTESPEKWSFPYFNDEVGQMLGSQMAEADTLLLGRRTYQEFAAYWPDKTAQQVPLKLVDARAFSTGVVSLVYQPAGT